jgi:AraC-like DNA-binding protein/mannose-6-phosphate isomerase-like protein (cupin superfamily)
VSSAVTGAPAPSDGGGDELEAALRGFSRKIKKCEVDGPAADYPSRTMARSIFQPFPMVPGRRAQVWRHQPSFRRPRHFHSEPEINFVARGTAVLGVGDTVLALEPGNLIVLPPGIEHELLDATADVELFVFALRPELAVRAYDPLAHTTRQVRKLEPAHGAELKACLLGLSDVRGPVAVESALADLFRASTRTLKPRHVLSRRALLAWERSNDLSERQLAARLQVDPATLSRCLREDLCARFVEYRARRRLMSFVGLAELGRPLSAAALEAGFGSYAQCHRVFARFLGCAPRDYFRGGRDAIAQLVAPSRHGA